MTAFLTQELGHLRLVPFGRLAHRAFQREVIGSGRPDVIALVAMMLPGIQSIEHPLPAPGAGFILGTHNPLHPAELAGVVLLYADVVTGRTAAGTYPGFLVRTYYPQMAASVTKCLPAVPGFIAHTCFLRRLCTIGYIYHCLLERLKNPAEH